MNVAHSEARVEAIYQILVEECGANTDDIAVRSFVYEFTKENPTSEYRFQGKLGFGGKFRYPRMTVDCYSEDETPAIRAMIEKANARLAAFKTSDSY